MIDENTDLRRWSAQWQGQPETIAADELRASVRRETRMLRLGLIAPVLVTLIIGGLSTWRATKAASVEGWVLLAGVWLFIALTWIVCLLLARGTWRPRADTTAAFIEVAVRRCESAVATVPFALVLYALPLILVLAWKAYYLSSSLAELLTAWPTVALGWIGMPLFWIFMLWYRKRKRAELGRLLKLKAELCAD